MIFPKPFMTIKELIELGIPECDLIYARYCSCYTHPIAYKSGKGKTSKWIYNTEELEKFIKSRCTGG